MRCRCWCCCPTRLRQSETESSDAASEDEEDDFWEQYEQREFDSFAFPPGVLCPALICCSVPATDEDYDDIPSFPRRANADQKHCWDEADGAGIK
ncbi:unnamed protein product, partial [Effrenium voratum]